MGRAGITYARPGAGEGRLMVDWIDIAGHPTWIAQQGTTGTPIVLLHGGLSDSELLLEALAEPLGGDRRIVAFDRRGHGYTADTGEPFHYDQMAIETIGVLEAVVAARAHLVGWSDGGIIALLVALRRPDLVERLVVIGANYHYDGVLPYEPEPDSTVPGMLAARFAERSPSGAGAFGSMAERFRTMTTTEPTLTTTDLAAIGAPTLVLAGDDDLIDLAHTIQLYQALPFAQLGVVPGASHALPIERPQLTAQLVLEFLDSDQPPCTMMPHRRRTPSKP